jgi:hypothetical protein
MAIHSVSERVEYLCRLVRRGVLDYHSPSFLPDAFRACVVSTHQLESGLHQFTQGKLPGGFDEVLTSFLQPTPDKSWSWVEGTPLPYIFLRFLAGLDILGGWVEHNKVPTLLSDKTISTSEMFETFNQVSAIMWRASERIITDAISFQYSVPGEDVLCRLYQGIIKSDGGPLRQTAASYLVALPVVADYLEKTRENLFSRMEYTTVATIVQTHEAMIRFILSTGDVRFGEFLSLLSDYLQALDAHIECPPLMKGDTLLERQSWNDFTGRANDKFLPHSPTFREDILSSRFVLGGAMKLEHYIRDDLWVKPEEMLGEFNFRFLESMSKTDRILGVTPRSVRFLRSILRNEPLRLALGFGIRH